MVTPSTLELIELCADSFAAFMVAQATGITGPELRRLAVVAKVAKTAMLERAFELTAQRCDYGC